VVATIVLALALFAGLFALVGDDRNVANADLVLLVIPIALLALRFGLAGGVAGALAGLALVGLWHVSRHVPVTPVGFVSRGSAFLLLGPLLGVYVDGRRKLEADISRYREGSRDLMATAGLDGYFKRLNPAWERLLGHSPAVLQSRPFIEFVHPDDREATMLETAAVTAGSRDSCQFRNRYLAADGSYRWLEWSAHGSPSEGEIYAVARDITVQHEAEQQLANNACLLEGEVYERTQELDAARVETLERLALASEYRDDDTYEHTKRVGQTAAQIACQLGLDPDEVRILREAAPLHDLGKLGISDTILLKPGPLSGVEYEIVQTHAELGAKLLINSSSPVLVMAEAIARSHHERWDGTGYPGGLTGEDIPLAARIVAVADVFDAMTSDRPYRCALPVGEALAEIEHGAGSQFDPVVVEAFLALAPSAREPSPAAPRAPAAPTREAFARAAVLTAA
jgi:PAS domain S-box-containing protein